MKKTILFILLFCGITFVSKAQLTVSGTGVSYYDSGVFNLNTSSTPFTFDAGTNVYVQYFSGGGCHGGYYIFRQNNYWYFGQEQICTFPSSYSLILTHKFTIPTTYRHPPCTGNWEGLVNNFYSLPFGSIVTISMTGSSCGSSIPTTSNATILPNLISLPRLTNAQILSIPSPVSGMITYDLTNACVSLYDGAEWKCMMPNFGPTVFKSSISKKVLKTVSTGFTLTDQYNHVIYNGIGFASPTMNIPLANTCSGREYIISNYGSAALTLSQSFINSSTGTTSIITQNTTVHLLSDGTSWYKVN